MPDDEVSHLTYEDFLRAVAQQRSSAALGIAVDIVRRSASQSLAVSAVVEHSGGGEDNRLRPFRLTIWLTRGTVPP